MRAKIIFYVIRSLALLPLGAAHGLGFLMGWLFYLIPNRERHNARVNIALCFPSLSTAEQARLVRKSLIENAKTIAEMPGIWQGTAASWLARIRPGGGQELVQELLSRGNGVIVLAPHLGCWEAGIHYLAQLAPITALYRPPKERILEQMMIEGRSKGGASLVPTSASGVKALYEALKRNEMITILPDQQPKQAGRSAGVFAPFFGTPALTMVLVNRLVRKTGAGVIFSYAERLPYARGYRVEFIAAPEGIGASDPVVAATALNLGVEHCVRRCPEQYQWSYKRFGVRPEGEPSLYRSR